MSAYQVAVVGAGINGLSTAYHLLLRGVESLIVLEQFSSAHNQGSSHGHSRITRSTYSSARYVELIQVAHSEEWPRLQAECSQPLLHPTPGCFFGPGLAPYLEAVQSVPEIAALVDLLSDQEARQVFPHFRFPDSPQVLRDRSCALVAAAHTLDALRAAILRRGGEILFNWPIQAVDDGSQRLKLISSKGTIEAERVVLSGGSWLGRLVPEAAPKLRPAHQDVAYFQGDVPLGLGHFPVWVYAGELGTAGDDTFYGLPEFGRAGCKVARHRTGRHNDDPDRSLPGEIPAAARADVETFVAQQFVPPLHLCGYEPCLYTNTTREDFLIDTHPQDERILLVSACSGHGFKFGPLTGRLAASILMDGKSDVAAFERHRSSFQLSQMENW